MKKAVDNALLSAAGKFDRLYGGICGVGAAKGAHYLQSLTVVDSYLEEEALRNCREENLGISFVNQRYNCQDYLINVFWHPLEF